MQGVYKENREKKGYALIIFKVWSNTEWGASEQWCVSLSVLSKYFLAGYFADGNSL